MTGYDFYNGDLKVVALLLGQQKGFTKFPCFISHGISEKHPSKKTMVSKKQKLMVHCNY